METATNKQTSVIFNTNSEFVLSLVDNDELDQEAEAAVVKNPASSWIKFGLTDDLPNENKQRVPQEEFVNLINTGVFMPLKMARGIIKPGHENSEPLGVITHLKKSGNKIVGLATVWNKERKEDVALLKELSRKKEPINISWEILYEDSKPSEQFDGVEDLLNVSLKAATIVGNPAYKGRTQILAMAAAWSKPYLSELSDDNFLMVKQVEDGKTRLFPYKDKNNKVDVEQLKLALSTVEETDLSVEDKKEIKKLAERLLTEANSSFIEENINPEDDKLEELEVYKTKVTELTTALATAEEALKSKTDTLEEVLPQLEELKAYKVSIEKTSADAEKFDSIKKKFSDASIEKSDDYFAEHKDFLLALDEKTLDFTIQELVSFAESSTKKTTEGTSSVRVPNVQNTKSTGLKSLAEELRKQSIKK